jgi:hypothetical protein
MELVRASKVDVPSFADVLMEMALFHKSQSEFAVSLLCM